METIRRGDERLVRATDGAMAVCLTCEPDFLRMYGSPAGRQIDIAQAAGRSLKRLDARLAAGPSEGEREAAYRAMSLNGDAAVAPSVRAWAAPDVGSLRLSNEGLIDRLWPYMAKLRGKNLDTLTPEQRSVFVGMAELAVIALNEVAHDVAGMRSPGRRDD